ncbi:MULTISPECIES: phage/plasmid replication protein, II/X family [Acinetobacter calcoaceticus/baumannii complex]|uniref:Phage/plasmid replication protein n=3 Tax=Acinetobacter TaxID=469 RepID=A0AA36KC16_ACINO|nr:MULTISPECIES: phage/plasmid replication protein, II/X family [Acinetobacter calcoaceticus/baumannii complex]EXE92947.1 phage/plasmid replication family protein [Acinetobacter sp. 259052]EYT16254.1 phage/plasmid replication family protein [Acinetobacter sp. 1592897]KQE38764.1 DNA replication protein [Acinetobacter nosocomialis]KRJ13618.1 DNA replication protein [Acinetobacter nosocomialis]MEC6036910.1 phage/plasmid replication protein, II/X family [Acinetobacter nosocomialis]
MLDHICINAPFESSFYSVDAEGRYFFVDIDLHSIEIPLASRSVHKNDDGSISAAALFHPFESVPTHYTGMAMKVFFDSSYEPFVQIKASPAKLLQGHNVFGSDNIEQGAMEMIGFLHEAYPLLARMLDWPRAWVSHIDVTYSVRLKDQNTAKKVLDFLSNVSNGQTRLSNKRFDSSVYWGGQTSRLVNHKCYMKHDEFIAQFEEYKQLAKKNDKAAQRVVDVMSNSDLINWTVGLLRFESRLKKRWLERNGIPTNLFDLIKFQRSNPNLLQTLWTKATHSIFDALRGQTMKLTDDTSVLEAIQRSDVVLTKSGKASPTKVRNLFAMYCLIREKGFDEVKTTYGKSQFHNLIAQLCAVQGLNKGILQNLHTGNANNIIPFIKFVDIDFNQQLPDWYEEPVSQFNYKIA